jgi:hypothetical protein
MDISNLFDANWWTSPGGKAPISAARDEIEPVIAPMRNGAGSLDPANVTPEFLKKYGVSPGAAPDVKEIVGLGKMRADAMRGTYKAPELSPLQFLASAVSAASVPVAYAQGNRSFAQAMTGNTLADKHLNRKKAYEDAAIQDHRDIVADTFGSVDKTVQSIQSARREKQTRALSGAEVLIRQGKYKDAIALLQANGLNEHATELSKRANGASTALAAQPSAAAPSQPGGPVSSPMPGVAVTQPQPEAPAGVPQAPATPGALPAGSGPAATFGASGSVLSNLSAVPDYQPSPAAQELINQAQYARAMGREDLAKQLDDQAKLIDTGREAFSKKEAEKAAEERINLVKDEPQAERTLSTLEESIDGMQRTIGDLLRPTKDGKGVELTPGAASNVGGPWDTYAPNMPGGKAASSWAKIEKLRSNIGVMVLTAMREASKTGGAVGNVTEKEWPILQNQLSSLDPNMSDDEFAASLLEINNRVENIKKIARQSHAEVYGGGDERTSAPQITLKDVMGAPVGTQVGGWTKTENGWLPPGSGDIASAASAAQPATPAPQAAATPPGRFRNPRGL